MECSKDFTIVVRPDANPDILWGTAIINVAGAGSATFVPQNATSNVATVTAQNATNGTSNFASNEGTFDWQSDVAVNCNVNIVAVSAGGLPVLTNWGIDVEIISADGMSIEILVQTDGATLGMNGNFNIPFALPIRLVPREVTFRLAANANLFNLPANVSAVMTFTLV